MRCRAYEKTPGHWWLDFRDLQGRRIRIPSGMASEAEALQAAPGVVEACRARQLTQTATALPEGTTTTSTTASPQQGSITATFRHALATRPAWASSRAQGTLKATFTGIDLPTNFPTAGLNHAVVLGLCVRWMDEPGKKPGTKLTPSTTNHRLSMLAVLLEVEGLPPHGVKHLPLLSDKKARRSDGADLSAMSNWLLRCGRKDAPSMLALVKLAMATAAAEAELLALNWADVGSASLTLTGRDGQTRTVPMTAEAGALLEARRGLPAPFPDLNKSRVKALWGDMAHALAKRKEPGFCLAALQAEAVARHLADGVNPLVVQAMAGRADLAVMLTSKGLGLGPLNMALRKAATGPQEGTRAFDVGA